MAVQVRLVCLIDIGSVLFCCQNVSRLKAVVLSQQGWLFREEKVGDFFPSSVRLEYRMILSCKMASQAYSFAKAQELTLN